ncbi:hypothetical protein M9H77_15470 [Catharanthus roseus]|uniref:Uncharacterized protein n=1 Tax=Catharanthus roseus TaxID=4058 RepID=A0ACC0AYU1_CATRO|nr:hypothetical protein M9H77_15470 [Catharanthus roseus]
MTEQRPTSILDLNMDSLVQCASHLSIQDISNMAITCKYLQKIAYSDSVWQSLFRGRWPQPIPYYSIQKSSVREAYLMRHNAVQQLKFEDPLVADFYADLKSQDFMLLDKNEIIYSQASLIHILKIDQYLSGIEHRLTLRDHGAKVTCMRLFPMNGMPSNENEMERNNTVLVTSSFDHSIRLWRKGSSYKCFRGHNGEVTTLSDKLLGDGHGTIFASGGIDCTVRLWSLNPTGKRGQHASKATLYGHEKPVTMMSVADHKCSLLASISKDSKVRVWDTTTASAVRSSCCVGMTTVRGAPVAMKSHESLLYVAAGSSVVSIDLRTMREVFSLTQKSSLYSFDVLPSKSLICTGGTGSAMLWDIRKMSDTKAKPMAELDGHEGPVKHLHMDAYKIVTGGPDDSNVNVWELETGSLSNSLTCSPIDTCFGCSAIAVQGCRIVTAGIGEEYGVLRYRDFSNARCHVSSDSDSDSSKPLSKFWDQQSCNDFEEADD